MSYMVAESVSANKHVSLDGGGSDCLMRGAGGPHRMRFEAQGYMGDPEELQTGSIFNSPRKLEVPESEDCSLHLSLKNAL